jgi:glutathionylspermidine synthase
VQREASAIRPGWEKKVEEVGLIYHHTAEGVYWDESVAYRLSMAEVLRIESASSDLQRLALAAAQHVIDKGRYADYGIPAWCVPLIENAWSLEPPALYGRMDFAFDGAELKLLEYNADTPTGLVEASLAQWYWLEDVHPSADQFNSLHEKLVAKWKDLAGWAPIHFAHVNQVEGEDLMTVTYLRETAIEAGLETFGLAITDIGWNAGADEFRDLDDRPIKTLFKLYPWEWLVHEKFGPYIAQAASMCWIEPIWKMLLSNKALLAIMFELEPNHPNLLPTFLHWDASLGSSFVRKPKLSREGANVTIVDGVLREDQPGDYGEEGFVYQKLANLGAHYPVFGSWLIDQDPAGLGIREPVEGRRITTNMSRFVPHYI